MCVCCVIHCFFFLEGKAPVSDVEEKLCTVYVSFKPFLLKWLVTKIIWCYKSFKSKGTLTTFECLCLMVQCPTLIITAPCHVWYLVWFLAVSSTATERVNRPCM
jgi:hypothetical protein